MEGGEAAIGGLEALAALGLQIYLDASEAVTSPLGEAAGRATRR
jgi:hypothetical protein